MFIVIPYLFVMIGVQPQRCAMTVHGHSSANASLFILISALFRRSGCTSAFTS